MLTATRGRLMRIVRAVMMGAACLAGCELTLRGPASDAAPVLEAAREMLGGEKTLAAVKTSRANV